MNKIQQLIDELKSRKSEADKMDEVNTKCGHYGIASCYQQRSKAYDFCIQELTLLLSDKHTGAITVAAPEEPDNLRPQHRQTSPNTVFAEWAATSETGDVGQNLGDIEPLIKGESPCAWDW